MLQKVAAKVDYAAADLGFMVCEVRWLLTKKFFGIAASSAASLCIPIYNIVLPYLRHYSTFVPKIGECSG